MAITPKPYSGSFTLQNLQDRCNNDENNLTAKLISLEAVKNTSGKKGTQATYDENDTQGLGKVKLKKDESSKHTAHILTVKTKVAITRS